MRSHYQKDFSQDDNPHTQKALDQLKNTDPERYEEYMRLKTQQTWEEMNGGPAPVPQEEPKVKRKRRPKTAGQPDDTQR